MKRKLVLGIMLTLFITLFLSLPPVSHADTLDTWIQRNPPLLTTNTNISSLISGKINSVDSFVLFVLSPSALPSSTTSSNLFILTSPDGVNWTHRMVLQMMAGLR